MAFTLILIFLLMVIVVLGVLLITSKVNNKEYEKYKSEKVEFEKIKLDLSVEKEKNTNKLAELDRREKELDIQLRQVRKIEKESSQRESILEKLQQKNLTKHEEIIKERYELLKTQEQFKDKKEKFEKEREKFLLQISNLTEKEAKEMLLKEIEDFYKNDKLKIINAYKKELDSQKTKCATEILLSSMENLASKIATTSTSEKVKLLTQQDKGKIIGKEGRNLKTIENYLGVNVIIDENPEYISISSYDPIRRAVAQRTLETLIENGKLNQATIEEESKRQKLAVDEIIQEKGNDAVEELELYDIPKEIIEILGKLYFRSSYSQNVLQHSIEVGLIAKTIAAEIGLDKDLAAKCGLLHDIGKYDSMQSGKSHPSIGYALAEKYNLEEEVKLAIKNHHDDTTQDIYTLLTIIADKVSASKVGNRKDTLERFIERISELEMLVKTFDEVQNAYALKGGREIRVIIDAKEVSEDDMELFADKIKRKIEQEYNFPGIIKVNLLREYRVLKEASKENVNEED